MIARHMEGQQLVKECRHLQRSLDRWKKVRLYNIGRKDATSRVLDDVFTLRNVPRPLRHLAIQGLGPGKPTLLIINRMDEQDEHPAGLMDHQTHAHRKRH